jgi:hypothetical protein
MQIKTTDSFKQQRPLGFRFWIGCFTLLLGLPIWLYYCYCWGVWGRNSLLLQYLFQCNCPASSEEARYPKEADLIIPACNNAVVMLFPNGHRLYVLEKNSGRTSSYLLNLQTREKTPIGSREGYFHFLSDDIVYVWLFGGEGEYILDGATGLQYPIQSYKQLHPNAFSNGYANTELLVKALSEADEVFLIDAASDPVIAISSDFRTNPEHNFIVYIFDLPEYWANPIEDFLQNNRVVYQYAAARFPWNSLPKEIVSPDGQFIARNYGIYLAETNQMIVNAPIPGVRGWTYDGRGVIYSSRRCLFQIGLPFADDTSCYRWVPQPVIMVKVPEKYLSPNGVP